MHIQNVTLEYDSQFGQYSCHAFAVESRLVEHRHGFSVSVIRSKFNLKSLRAAPRNYQLDEEIVQK